MKTRFLSIGLLIVMTTTAMPQALPDDVIERAKSLGLDLQGQVNVGGAGAGVLKGAYVKDSSFTLAGLEGLSLKLDGERVNPSLKTSDFSLRPTRSVGCSASR